MEHIASQQYVNFNAWISFMNRLCIHGKVDCSQAASLCDS